MLKDALVGDPTYLALLTHGVRVTLVLFAVSWVLAMTLAAVLTAVRSQAGRLAEGCVALFVAYHRNVPGLVQIFVWYFGVPQLLHKDWQRWLNRHDGEWLLACVALTLYAAAYMSEDLRSGLRAVPRGQEAAARSLGMRTSQMLRYVLLPQALRAALPPLVNQALALFKATSLAMTIGVAELMHATRQIENETFRTFEAFLVASLLYLAGSWAIMAAGAWATARLSARAGWR